MTETPTQSAEFDAGRTSAILEVIILINEELQKSADSNTVFAALTSLFSKVARLGYTEANK